MSVEDGKYARWFAEQMELAKRTIAAKTDGLVTRQTLRDEKWAEFTLRKIVALLLQEERARESLELEESPYTSFYTRWALQLERLVVEGTTGTVIHVEESETPARQYIERQQLDNFNSITEVDLVEGSRSHHMRLERERLDAEEGDRGRVEVEEQVRRFELSEVYEVEWPLIWAEEREARRNVTLLLLWRIVVEECDERLCIEASEVEQLRFLPAVGSEQLRDWAPQPSTTPFVEKAQPNDEPATKVPIPVVYSHFGHTFIAVPPTRLPGDEPLPLKTIPITSPISPPTTHTAHMEAEEVHCPESESDVSESELIKLREEIFIGWSR